MAIIYRDMDRTALDTAYDNSRATADFAQRMAAGQARSQALYAQRECRRGLHYGPEARQVYDWLGCGKAQAPTLVFIHGGYWQHCSREDFAFIAEGPLQCGFDVALAEYTLAPEASLTRIVSEIGQLLDHLHADRDGLGRRGQPLLLSGHSAGGHLTAQHRSHRAVSAALAISALVDLEPISLSWLNDKLKLTPRETDSFSPLLHIRKGAPTVVAVGSDELSELRRQSEEYASACQTAGERVERVWVPGCTHLTVLDDLARADGLMLTALRRLAGL